jgi:hypothetical protein
MRFLLTVVIVLLCVSCFQDSKTDQATNPKKKEGLNIERVINQKAKEVELYETYLTAVKDLKNISGAFMEYQLNNDQLPDIKTTEELKDNEFFTHVNLKDPWGQFYLVKAEGENLWIATGGSDKQFQGFDQTGSYSLKSGRGKDIILKNHEFILNPD